MKTYNYKEIKRLNVYYLTKLGPTSGRKLKILYDIIVAERGVVGQMGALI